MSPDTDCSDPILPGVIEIVARIGNLPDLLPDRDLYEAGVTSIMALPLLLELEDRFQVSIPDELFIAARTPRALAGIVAQLRGN